jgi:hypothetical protein
MGRKRTGRRWWLITFGDEDEIYFGDNQEAEWFREFKEENSGHKARKRPFNSDNKRVRDFIEYLKNPKFRLTPREKESIGETFEDTVFS